MATKSEVKAKIEALTKELETADDDGPDDEVWVKKGDHETKLTGERARNWLKTHGYDSAPEPAGDGKGDQGDGDQGDGHEQDGKPPAGHGYFRSRKG